MKSLDALKLKYEKRKNSWRPGGAKDVDRLIELVEALDSLFHRTQTFLSADDINRLHSHYWRAWECFERKK